MRLITSGDVCGSLSGKTAVLRSPRRVSPGRSRKVLVLYLERPHAQFKFACALGRRF